MACSSWKRLLSKMPLPKTHEELGESVVDSYWHLWNVCIRSLSLLFQSLEMLLMWIVCSHTYQYVLYVHCFAQTGLQYSQLEWNAKVLFSMLIAEVN